jgi:hypothetical protein
MFRIDDATAATSLPTPETAGTEGYFTEGDPVAGTPATNVRGSWLNMIQEELRALVVYGGLTPSKTVYTQVRDAIVAKFAKINGDSTQAFSVAAATQPQHAAQLSQIAAPIGAMSNGVVALLSASNSLTFTADQVIVGSALNGLVYSVPSVNLTINTSTVGANGMNSGTPTASWFVAVYLLYNPLTGAKALLGINEAAATQPPMVCAAAGIPAGYTASALIGSYWTNGSGQFSPCTQRDRRIWNNGSNGISGVGTVTLNGFVWPSVPNAAKTVSGAINITNTTTSADTCILYSFPTGGPSSRGLNRNGSTGGVQAQFTDLAINPSFTRASYMTSTQTGTGLTITAFSTDYTI